MAKKIDASLAKQLKALNINAKTEDEARKKLLAVLEKEGVEGMDDEDTETLIEMVDSFINDGEEPEEEETETEEKDSEDDDSEEDDEEETEANELADEAEEEETEEDSEEDDEEETEEVEEKPVKKKAAKKSEKKTEKPAKEEKKVAKKVSKRGVKLDLKNSEDDRKELSKLVKMFKDGYNFAWLSGAGLTVKHVGKNGNRGIFTIDNVTKLPDGTIRCNLYLVTMTKQTEKLEDMGIDFEKCWTGAPCMKGISLDEVIEILEKVYDTITSFANAVDKRLGENRKKMEENLKNGGKAETKAKTKKAVKPEEEDDEEETEEVEEKPVKKKAAKKSKK